MNVAFGGTLLQHIEGDAHRAEDEGRGASKFHEVTVEDGTLLRQLLGVDRIETNSRHHQAVAPEAVGDGLRVSARAGDGIIEGIESPRHRWMLGVQWHPERPEVADRFQALFRAFVAAAAEAPVRLTRT